VQSEIGGRGEREVGGAQALAEGAVAAGCAEGGVGVGGDVEGVGYEAGVVLESGPWWERSLLF
jgi:hypothetical protein